MRYDVRLVIDYAYGAPVRDARHILRVRPRGDRGQTVEQATLVVDPSAREAVLESDFFGNPVDHLRLATPHQTLSIVLDARVTVDRRFSDFAATPSCNDVALAAAGSRDTGPVGPGHGLGASRLVSPSERIGRYAWDVTGRETSAGVACLKLAQAIRSDFIYMSGSTSVRTRPDDALEARRGVCQDFAHVMIAGLRSLGLPAAYVSGFLRTDPPPGQPRILGVDAMHAWVDVWLGPEIGWAGFDPTNGCAVGDGHIVVAVGRDYADVAPIDGVLLTSGAQSARHFVDVIPLEP